MVGIPKTIDNDIKFCFRTFGFFTAVAEAEKAVVGSQRNVIYAIEEPETS